MASPIDLTDISTVKSWLAANGIPPNNNSDDLNISACITAFSAIFIWQTGMGPLDGSNITASPFVQPVAYNEWYDGNGGQRMFLRNRPITSVTLLQVGPYQVPASTGWGVAGYVIDGTFSSIALRGGGGNSFNSPWWGQYSGYFPMEIQNVNIQYMAGYAVTPPDLNLAATKSVALNYKRKDWIGLKSKAMANGAGSTIYTEFEYDPDVARLFSQYTRWAPV